MDYLRVLANETNAFPAEVNLQLTPATGPLCVGVWKQVGQRTFQLHHVGWNFDINGNPLGSFTLDETNTVSRNGLAYKGTFDLKFYDVDGNLVDLPSQTPGWSATRSYPETGLLVLIGGISARAGTHPLRGLNTAAQGKFVTFGVTRG